jgi:hypothetical protein
MDDGDARYGNSIFVVKSADTSRSNTTTFANDPHLSIVIPTTGLWSIELKCLSVASDATGGLKSQLLFTGTINATGRTFYLTETSNQGVTVPGSVALTTTARAGTAAAPTIPIPIISSTNRAIQSHATALLEITAVGTLSLQWAQNASSATATIVPSGCYLKATRVGSL